MRSIAVCGVWQLGQYSASYYNGIFISNELVSFWSLELCFLGENFKGTSICLVSKDYQMLDSDSLFGDGSQRFVVGLFDLVYYAVPLNDYSQL